MPGYRTAPIREASHDHPGPEGGAARRRAVRNLSVDRDGGARFADFYVGDPDAVVFGRLAALGAAFFATMAMATREGSPQLNRRMGVLLVNLLWVVFCLVGAIPLWL